MVISEWLNEKVIGKSWFNIFIAIVIISGGLLAGLQTFENINKRYHVFFNIADIIIIFIFIIEMLVYMLAHGWRFWRYFYDPWHIFDFFIIVLSILPFFLLDTNTGFIIVFRLARIIRLTRIFEKLYRLKLILNTILRVIPKAISVLFLLLIILYIYGVVTTDLLGKYSPEKFGELWRSMGTLYFTILDTWVDLYNDPGLQKAFEDGFPKFVFFLIFASFQLFSALILLNFFVGLITSELESIRESQKQGKDIGSFKGHTLILGWNESIFSIIDELKEANLIKEFPKIVILSSKEKSFMDYEIKIREKGFSTTRIYTVQGCIYDPHNLELVNAWNSNSIIILNERNSKSSDYVVFKAILALLNFVGAENKGIVKTEINNDFHIVAEIYDDEIKQRIKEIDLQGRVVLFNPEQFLNKVIAQAILNPNISNVYYEILGFKGNEFYVRNVPKKLLGFSYERAIFCFNKASLVGVIKNDTCILNPPKDYILEQGDKIVLLAEDENKLNHRVSNKNQISEQFITKKSTNKIVENTVLIWGYSSRIPAILSYLSGYYTHLGPSENRVKIVLENKEEIEKLYQDLGEKLNNSQLNFKIEPLVNRSLEEILRDIDVIVIMAETDKNLTSEEIDVNTLYKLRVICNKQQKISKNSSIIAEFLSESSLKIAKNENVTDYIVGSNILGPVIAQLSQEKELIKVFDTLFVSQGAEIYVRNVEDYLKIGSELNFATIVASTIRQNETAIGVIRNYLKDNLQVILNPGMHNKFKLTPNDKIIVLAEEI